MHTMNHMDLLAWDDKYSVKVAEIDTQHKQMFHLINNLFHAMEKSKAPEQIQPILKGFIDYADFHFTTEEKYFTQFNYPDKDAHILAHRSYSAKIQELLNESTADKVLVSTKLMDFVEDWWIQHVTGMDQKYAQFFNDHGLH
jgi:hemerythrin-like metal-binding protein